MGFLFPEANRVTLQRVCPQSVISNGIRCSHANGRSPLGVRMFRSRIIDGQPATEHYR
jgi:hypothetical protein